MSIDQKIKRKAIRYLKNDLSYETYSTKVFTFLETLGEGSKDFFETATCPSLIGFGSYQNSHKNTFSNIHSDKASVEYIEINNNWTPEYYITFNEDRRKIFSATIALIKKVKSLGTAPDGISVKIINRTAVKDRDTILRKPYVIAGLEILWETRTVAVAEFLGKLKHIFPDIIECPSSIIITDQQLADFPISD
jgi:hypothetical protein